jgi:hypothetical protein
VRRQLQARALRRSRPATLPDMIDFGDDANDGDDAAVDTDSPLPSLTAEQLAANSSTLLNVRHTHIAHAHAQLTPPLLAVDVSDNKL